jgi:hypothetical protein
MPKRETVTDTTLPKSGQSGHSHFHSCPLESVYSESISKNIQMGVKIAPVPNLNLSLSEYPFRHSNVASVFRFEIAKWIPIEQLPKTTVTRVTGKQWFGETAFFFFGTEKTGKKTLLLQRTNILKEWN